MPGVAPDQRIGPRNGDAQAGYVVPVGVGRRPCWAARQPIDHTKRVTRIFNRVGEESDRVQGRAQGHHSGRRPPSGGVPVSDDTRRRSGNPDRSAGVAPERQHGGPFPQAHSGSRGRPARHTVVGRVPGVHRGTRVRVESDSAECQLDGVRLAHDHAAELPDRAHEKALALPAGRELTPGAGSDRETFHAVEILHRDSDAREWTGVVTACHGPIDGRGLCACAVGVKDDVGAEIAGFVTTDCVFDHLEGRFFAASYAGGRLPDGFSFHGYTPGGAPRQTRAADCNLQYRLCLEMRIASPSDHPLRRARRSLAADRNVVLVRVRALPGGLQWAGGGGVFADPANALRPGFLSFLGMIGRFNGCGKGRRAPSDEASSARSCRMYRVGGARPARSSWDAVRLGIRNRRFLRPLCFSIPR